MNHRVRGGDGCNRKGAKDSKGYENFYKSFGLRRSSPAILEKAAPQDAKMSSYREEIRLSERSEFNEF